MTSTEQQAIIDEIIKNNNNVACCAVAGSGKTTTIINLAKQHPGRILQITYNARLKHEVREKAAMLQNLVVHTYHSMMCSYYGNSFTDMDMDKLIKTNKKIKAKAKADFDVIVIDECQDMTGLYFRAVNKLITDTKFEGILVVLGDIKQAINEFRGADSRYLSLPEVWKRPFVNMPLSTSFRLPAPIANFVSEITKQKIVAIKDGAPIQYLFGEYKIITSHIIKEITTLLANGYNPGDIFILAPSMKSTHTLSRMLESALVKMKIMCYIDCEDDRTSDKELVYDSKIVFCTINSTKGLERKVVFLYNFDSSYTKYYNRIDPPSVCSNALYVAMTRASERLILIHSIDSSNLVFVTPKSQTYLEFSITKPLFSYDVTTAEIATQRNFTVTELVAHIHFDIIGKISELLTFEISSPAKSNIVVANVESFGDTYEYISDIVGVAIPIMYECELTGTHRAKSKFLIDGEPIPSNPVEFAKVAIRHISEIQNIKYKTAQITNFEWFTEVISEDLLSEIRIITGVEEFESPCSITIKNYTYKDKNYKINITGSIDIIAKSIAWEVKCVTTIKIEHLMQIMIYNWLKHVDMKIVENMDEVRKYLSDKKIYSSKLLNIRTGEIRNIKMSANDYCDLIEIIINSKLQSSKGTDEEFILLNDLEQ